MSCEAIEMHDTWPDVTPGPGEVMTIFSHYHGQWWRYTFRGELGRSERAELRDLHARWDSYRVDVQWFILPASATAGG